VILIVYRIGIRQDILGPRIRLCIIAIDCLEDRILKSRGESGDEVDYMNEDAKEVV
jgi:hypothetical protein